MKPMSPEPVIDLDAYCERIGYAGFREPTLAVLREVHFRHAVSIPFENLAVLAGRRISIAPADVEQKLVCARQGGYCFEHSTLMMHALRALGFEVEPLMARIRWQVPAGVTTNLGHMRLKVRLPEGTFLADAGLGSTTLTEPLRLEPGLEQRTALDRRRLRPVGAELLEQVNFGREWADVCLFSPEPAPQADIELGNWYYCTHPDSIFLRNLVVARPDVDRRYSIFNREFAIRPAQGPATKETIASPERLGVILQEYFGLECPDLSALAVPELQWDRAPR